MRSWSPTVEGTEGVSSTAAVVVAVVVVAVAGGGEVVDVEVSGALSSVAGGI